MAKKKSIKAIKEDNSSIENSKDVGWCFFERKMKPYPVEELAAELMKFAENEDFLRMSQFAKHMRMRESDYYDFVDRYEVVKKAHLHALSRIAERRELGAITGKYREATIMPYMAMYDKDFKKFVEWKASLTRKDEEKSETKIVVIERYPDTGLPSVKKVDDPQKVDQGDS